MIELIENDSGLTVSLKVQPNAKRNTIIGEHGNKLKLSVTAVPENGKANKAVVVLLSKELGIKASNIQIVSGFTSRDKKVHIKGLFIKNFNELINEH